MNRGGLASLDRLKLFYISEPMNEGRIKVDKISCGIGMSLDCVKVMFRGSTRDSVCRQLSEHVDTRC